MQTAKRPLKRSMIGFEVEMFTINSKGYIISTADMLLKKAKSDKNYTIKKECASNMVEIASYPEIKVHNTMDYLLTELEYLDKIAAKNNIFLCPLGTYPGKFNPTMRDERQYQIKQSIFGKNRFKIAGRTIGFHCHYSLPKGIFDSHMRLLKMLIRSKIKDSFVNSYNFLIAADPALTTFMQSSPYYQGEQLGKDSRMIVYRGGHMLGYKNGLYANLEEFGGLPPYKLTALDLMHLISTRYEKWKSYVKSMGLNIKVLSLYGSILNTSWNPVKVNPNGTLEQRGMDMNHPIYIAGIGVAIKYILKKLQEEYYSVVPSEIGIRDPFRVEKDIIYIPPDEYVRNIIQRESAYKGLDSPIVYDYCKRFLRFAQSTMPKNRYRLLEPFKKMLNEKKTVSDDILNFARKNGFKKREPITNKFAAEIALQHSERLLTEIIETRKLMASLSD